MQCVINDDQNPPNLWSYNSSCAALNPHAFALARLLSMLYTERYIVKCVSFMLANTPIAMCTQYTANETHFTKECHKHKTDTVLIYIQCTSQNVWLTIVINMSDTVVPRVEQIENLRWAWGQSFLPGSRSCWWLVRTRGGQLLSCFRCSAECTSLCTSPLLITLFTRCASLGCFCTACLFTFLCSSHLVTWHQRCLRWDTDPPWL